MEKTTPGSKPQRTRALSQGLFIRKIEVGTGRTPFPLQFFESVRSGLDKANLVCEKRRRIFRIAEVFLFENNVTKARTLIPITREYGTPFPLQFF
jgi:hypothetical protein